MAHREMTIAEILEDPLINLMMRADRVSPRQMRQLLQDAAHGQSIRRQRNSAIGAAREPASRQPG